MTTREFLAWDLIETNVYTWTSSDGEPSRYTLNGEEAEPMNIDFMVQDPTPPLFDVNREIFELKSDDPETSSLPGVPAAISGVNFTPPDVQGTFCLPAGQSVFMGGGKQMAEAVSRGDVFSTVSENDPEGEKRDFKVVETYQNGLQNVVRLRFRVETGKEFDVRSSVGHRFYVRNLGFEHAERIPIGSQFVNHHGQTVELLFRELEPEAVPVYNFEVERAHTYFVGDDAECSVLSHNQTCATESDACPYCLDSDCDGHSSSPVSWSLLRSIYAGNGQACDNLYNAARGKAGDAYNANKGKAHAVLQTTDMLDPSGLSGAVDGILTGIEEGHSVISITVGVGADLAGSVQKKAQKAGDAIDHASGMAKRQRKAAENTSSAAKASQEMFPPVKGRPFRGEDASKDAFNHLEKHHGIPEHVASNRLHAIKKAEGLGAADGVIIGRTGDVYDALTNRPLGSLTAPSSVGLKR